MKQNIIWDGTQIDFSEAIEELKVEFPGESEAWYEDRAVEDHCTSLDDERMNLDVEVEGELVIIANLGLWNGRVQGIKVINSRCISDILYSQCNGEIKFYADKYNVRAEEHHHDGTNYYLYREMREGRDMQRLIERISSGEQLSMKTINYYTKSIVKDVNAVYGW